MKAQTKAVVASIVVVALALSAISGVTYSWFSDSETSEIDVSTAKVDIDGRYVEDSPVVTTSGDAAVTDTTAKYTSDKKNIEIKNFIDQRKITAKYELTNTSTVNILYRMYVVVEGVSDDVAGKLVSVKSSSTEIDLIPLVFRDGRACAVDTDPSKKIILNAPTTESKYTFTLIIDSKDVSVQGISTFKVKIINEAYQSDYEYSNDQTIKSGEAQLPSGIVTEDVTFSGTTSAAEGVHASDAEVTFSANTLNKITDNGNMKVTLKTETLAPEGNVAKISLKLDGSDITDFGTEKVTVTLSIPGQYTGLKVKYAGSGTQPTDVNCDYDSVSSMTKITFSTTHFSEFEVVAGENSTARVDDEDSFIAAITSGVSRIELTDNIEISDMPREVSSRLYVGTTYGQTLDLNEFNLTILSNESFNANNFAAFYVKGTFTVEGTGAVTTTDASGEYGFYGFTVLDHGHLTLKGGEYCCLGTVVQVQSNHNDVNSSGAKYSFDCSCIIEDGKFTVCPFEGASGYKFVLNYIDALHTAALKEGKELVIVKGGQFINYDPSNSNSESPTANFVEDGYRVINEGEKYTVVKIDFTGNNVVFDGETYYTSMANALNGIHKTGKHTLWCKPNADLGEMNHQHVCSDLTIYGNGAYISAGSRDFAIDDANYDEMSKCEGMISDVTLTVYSLNNMSAWGARHTQYTLNINLYNCKDMRSIYFTNASGPINVYIYNCSFDGDIANKETALYTNAVGTIHVENTTFSNYMLGVNQNNKSGGLQTIELIDCVFNDCGVVYNDGWKQFTSAVRIVASESGSISKLTESCVFNYSEGKTPARENTNILFGDDRADSKVSGTVYHNGEIVDQLKPAAKA